MKKHDDGRINEDDINNLIQYAEDTDSDMPKIPESEPVPEPELHAEKPETETKKEPQREEEYLDYDGYDDDHEIVFENEKPYTRKGVVIGIIIGIAAVIAFITIDTGIIGSYKKNFSQNFSKVFSNFKSDKNEFVKETASPETEYKTGTVNNVVVSFEGANDTQFAVYRGGIVCAKMNHMYYMDASGALVWETDTAVVDPILKTEGNYILLTEHGRNKICLYNDSRLIYDVDDPDAIRAAQLSSNGDVVVVTDKSSYKGGVSVYNKTGAQIFSWASGSDAVMCADICADSRRVAVALLNTEQTVKSVLQLFDVNETQSYAQAEMEDTAVYDVRFSGDIVTVFGDNRVMGVKDSGKIIYDNTFADVQLTHSSADTRGATLLSLDDGNVPKLNVYNKRGSQKKSVTLTGVADFIDINGSDIIYNTGRDVYFGDTKSMNKYTAAMDIKKLLILSDRSFVIVYSNSLEFVTV